MLDDLQGKPRHDADEPIKHGIDRSNDVFEGGEFDELEVCEDYEEEVGLRELYSVDDLLEG